MKEGNAAQYHTLDSPRRHGEHREGIYVTVHGVVRACHPERSEGSRWIALPSEILRCDQDDGFLVNGYEYIWAVSTSVLSVPPW
jgi:hypothetical protein